jgi:excinuclease ABC subunit A
MTTGPIHTVKPLDVRFPKGRLSAVTGVSGSGKTTLILESLLPGLTARICGRRPCPAM